MSTNHTPQQALAALLELYSPEQLLVISNNELPALNAFHSAHPDKQIYHAPAAPLSTGLAGRRYDLALVVDCLEHLPKRTAMELLGGLRNLNTNRIVVLVDLQASNWSESDFFSLALQVSARFQRDEQTLTLFTYDLHDYKQVPDWLNAKCWAKPEMFGKYWW